MCEKAVALCGDDGPLGRFEVGLPIEQSFIQVAEDGRTLGEKHFAIEQDLAEQGAVSVRQIDDVDGAARDHGELIGEGLKSGGIERVAGEYSDIQIAVTMGATPRARAKQYGELQLLMLGQTCQ